MMPSWSNRLRINPLTALLVLVAAGVFGFLSGDSPAVAQGTLPAPTNGTAVSNTAEERTLARDGGGNADSFLLVAVHTETFDYANENGPDGAARTGTVTGLTGGADDLGIVGAPQATGDGLATPYGVAELVAVQGVDSQCSADDYDRDEWGDYPGAPDAATPTWTLPPDNVAATDITLDHHVALQDAHISGGCDWSSEIKNDFATDPDNLNPTTRSFNSSKGSRTPDQLTGIAESIIDTDDEKCDYATQHDAVKDEYDLTMTANEQATVTEWLSLCQVAPEFDASTDKAALVALYNATEGPNWANNRNWLSDRPIGEWSRVSTDGDGRVTGLWVDGNQLSGSIPPELGNLDNLHSLSLSYNQLSGSIPSQLGNLDNLGVLWLDGNQLSGSIPSQLGNLANLYSLWLSGNQLSGSIPSQLGNLDNLERLSLDGNQLSGSIPSQLGNLDNLERLSLDGNQLSGSIPSQLGNLDNLEYLGLSSNQLSGSIPSQLGNLANLEYLGLSSNQLSGSIPSQLGNLANLRTLYLGGNQLSGSIPPELGNLDNLERLSLSNNQLSGEIPPWLGNLTKLEWLRLDGNEFTGQIPNGLSRLSNVTFLVLSGNQLTGQIPSWLGNMTSLERLDLSDNRLSGEIPTTLGNLPNLRLIRLGGNSLTGCIPDSLQPVADNDFNRLGLPVCQAEPTASLGPSTGEGPYSIVNNDLDYSYTISLTNAWDQEREGVYSRTFPWSQLRVTSQYIETGTNLKNFSETVRSGLRDEWWPNASLFDISSVEEVQLGDVPSYRMRYRVQESPQYCLVDVEEAIVISDALPGYPKGFRVRAWMCESQVRAHGSERGETLDSFRIVTIPSPYYQQFIFTNGVTVKATDGVDPAALRAGADIVVTMLSGRQDLARCMAQRGAALAIIPRDQPVTTLPEYAHLRGTYDFTGRSRDTFDLRGLGAAEPLHPVSSAGEEQLLGQFGPQHPYYPYRGWVAVHEFAHGIQNICFTAADDIRWREFYVAALNANLYPGTHMMADVKEFFAAFSTGYFEVSYELGPDSTRDSLKTRFPSVFESLDAIYGGATLPQEYREIIPR